MDCVQQTRVVIHKPAAAGERLEWSVCTYKPTPERAGEAPAAVSSPWRGPSRHATGVPVGAEVTGDEPLACTSAGKTARAARGIVKEGKAKHVHGVGPRRRVRWLGR